MTQNHRLKTVLCYSHQDTPFIEEFRKHSDMLISNGLIKEWYDRKILAGEDFQKEIDDNLEDADIVCLFLSANFLSSDNCNKEKRAALELRKKKWIRVILIILSPCGWLDDKSISSLLALPEDGKPVSDFQGQNKGWNDVYNGFKKIIEEEIRIKQSTKIRTEFEFFLRDTEILARAHSQKESVFLDDIFVYPELGEYDSLREHKKDISSNKLLENLLEYPKIVLVGEDQSGKTTLCKMIFKELRKMYFIPVYVSDKKNRFEGEIENKIAREFRKQYNGDNINEINHDRIVPIIDDFHFAKNKDKHMKDLSVYPRCIIVADDIFILNIRDNQLVSSFAHFEIKEFKPSLRVKLIKKWVGLTDRQTQQAENDSYLTIDKTTELINSTLGNGIMPSYPFFILSVIFTYETFTPIDQEITSLGYCYQAFIYFYLRKCGVKNDEIDIYINFLTELAFYIYKERNLELSDDDFHSFMKLYLNKYNFPIKQKTLLKNLEQIVQVDSFNNRSFKYLYLYYFFVAKYFAEHIEDNGVRKEMEEIIKNLHVNENAYIAIFIAHHSRSTKILKEIELNASHLFDKSKPATLTKDEVKFFDKQEDIIVKTVLPLNSTTPEKERNDRLNREDELEQRQEDEEDPYGIELRRAIKTVEVLGHIIKNRAGSLEKVRLEEIFREAMNVHLNILFYFFELIKSGDEQKALIDFISERLKKTIQEKEREPSKERIERLARIIFWNINFLIVYGIIDKIVRSLGSDKLIDIVNSVCDKVNTPASFLVKHGILMWYKKNIQINEIAKRTNENDFSKIAKKAIELMVINYCSLHQINFRDKQKITDKLGIPVKKNFFKKDE